MEEGESTSGGGADLLMECDEEEQEVWPQSLERDKEEEEQGHDGAREAAVSLMEEEETNPPPVRIIPIPVPPVSSCSPPTHIDTLKCSGAPLGFMVNGRPVPLLPGGGSAELKLCSHPGGSASGFTSVQIPVPTPTASSTTAPSLPAAGPEGPTPVITGVVSGEAAQRVMSNNSVNLKPLLPPTGLKTPPSVLVPSRASPLTPSSPRTTPPASQGTKPPPRRHRPAAPHKLPHKDQLGPVPPPVCLVCTSQFQLVTELRGFMCLCSPAIAQSLKNLKTNSHRRRSRDKSKTSKPSRVSRTRPGPPASPLRRTHRLSDDFLPDQFTSPAPFPTTCSPQQDQSETPPDPCHGKLVIMVEDFYYGSASGRISMKPNMPARKFTGPYRCIHCPKTLRNNIKLMSHMQQHVSTMTQQHRDPDSLPSCPHCFRLFLSPFKLQCHLEGVHSQYESTAKCKICELEFGSEAAFLWHMKNTHKPGEMPYACQVCDFRSSFYSDVWSHFQQVHADTKHLLCQYCLRVLRSNTCYQQHFARHQKKHVFSCDKCRLHFLYIKERIEHKLLHHRTHIRPQQLTGLKPGTKVTVRTYSVVGPAGGEEALKKTAPCKVVDAISRTQEAPKRKPVESLGPLLSHLSQDREAAGVSRPSACCLECLSSVWDFRSHFPSLVHCSLCRFVTCCSRSYANHMINNHATCRKKPQYHSIFLSDSRLSQRLRCVSCTFSTCRGDMMANHLTERPEHRCIITHHEPSVSSAGTQPTPNSNSVTSSVNRGGGAFIPIHLLPSGQTSTQLSVKPLTSPSPLSSPPAMTIKFLGPRPQPDQCPVSRLSASQLSAVLFALCHGLPQASCRYQTSPLTIRSWIRQQERQLLDRKWRWSTEKVVEWVLSQREQQLRVSEDFLLQTARRALGEDRPQLDCYSWTVDLMLRHKLGLQPADSSQQQLRRLPRTIRDKSRKYVHLLSAQIHRNHVPPHCVGFMDEFSIFIDSDRFSNQNPSAFQLFGSSVDKPVFDVVLSALSDGTFLRPLLFFRGTPSHVPEGFPDNVLLEARQEGFTDRERLHVWINEVWRPRVASQCNTESVLMVDAHRGHLTDEFRDSLASMSTDVFFIPPGCCCRLQPLDVCVTPVLRHFLQARWTQLVSQGGLDGLGLDQLALTLACWLSEVCFTLNSETHILCRSFASVCNLQEVEDQGEAARMIQALTEALVQPLETSAPTAGQEPGPELELQVVTEEEEEQQQQQQQQEEEEEEQQQQQQQEEEQQQQQQQEEEQQQQQQQQQEEEEQQQQQQQQQQEEEEEQQQQQEEEEEQQQQEEKQQEEEEHQQEQQQQQQQEEEEEQQQEEQQQQQQEEEQQQQQEEQQQQQQQQEQEEEEEQQEEQEEEVLKRPSPRRQV